ncbi:MAG: DUF2723 domain-containing protein [Bacteroidota bacterium]|nr:DUF2723 domain-containing protein [Bacteroidota bacterium]
MKKFKSINNIAGWIIFLIASAVYILTIEPTASFWDCGEFIATALKLEVGHPPGNPLFAMLGRLATLFAGGNVYLIPKTVNIYSALCSGFTILFLFWSITHLARKITGVKEEYTITQLIAIIGSGAVGALAYTFTDSFWFSAVEAEVYASSSLFTALVFWAILKWENEADEKFGNRWLILIAYLMGLSIGVHLLNLLAIPAIGMVYYFRKYTPTRNGIIAAFLISSAVLGVVLYGVVQGVFVFASWFELLFVNDFGLPFNSGWVFYTVALSAAAIWGIWYTHKKGKILWNTVIMSIAVILLGYSSYAACIIRSNANTPLNENNPANLFNLLSYLNREQYGDRPLLYGQYYNAPVTKSEEGKAIYAQKDGKYVAISHRPEYVYDSRFCGFFPRMYSNDPSHVQAYKSWANIKGTPIQTTNQQGQPETVYKPTFGENLKFFLNYQVNWMYFRYFMWNFVGRQSDIQGHGDPIKGNWISGIKFIDEMRLGPQDKLPDSIGGYKFKSNKARNTYFFLPLLLGLAGLFYHYKKHQKDFWIVMILFFMTGLAIVLYLNQTPFQPRERDYAYAGSFYAFAIWIGLGVMALIDWAGKKSKGALTAGLIAALSLVLVPGIMAQQNWDDHDRSDRYTCRDFAYNYLNSCAPNAILFTNGDNDTFPLWYIQEVEGVRTDVRVVNLSYLGADWYIEQMQRKVYDSDALPTSMSKEKYQTGTRDALYIVDRVGDYADIKDVMDFVASDKPETKSLPNVPDRIEYLPANKLKMKVDTTLVRNNGTVTPSFSKYVVPEMKWELKKKNAIYKNDMMVLDILAHNNWKRPIYFAITVSDDNYMGLDKYLRLDGLAYRIVPIESNRPDGQAGSIDSKLLYDNLMNKFKWGNIQNPKVYLDENNMRMLSNFRSNFARLAEQLLVENKRDSAVKVLDRCLQIMPVQQIPLNYWALPIIEQYYKAKENAKATKISQDLFASLGSELSYYFRLKGKFAEGIDQEKRMALYTLNELGKIAEAYGQKSLKSQIDGSLQNYMGLMGPMQ